MAQKTRSKFSSDKHASCSGLPALFGISKHETRTEYMQSRLDARAGKVKEKTFSRAAEMGHKLENTILQLPVEHFGLTNFEHDLEYAVEHPDYPLQGSIDGIAKANNLTIKPDNDFIYTEDDDEILIDGKGILEAKATAILPSSDGKPPLYRGVLQVKALMAITQYSWAMISTLHSSTLPKICVYQRDFAFERDLKETILDFERRLKEKDYYPPVTHSDTQIMFPVAEKDKAIDLDTDEVTNLCKTILNGKEQVKSINSTITQAEIRLQEIMGNASIGHNKNYTIKWGSRTYKAQPEKVIPAKDGYTVRNKSVAININETSAD
ncbi:MAG: hypothetical protein GOVbin1578_16 [Prokaryotic dsDNA virus sp.]|nr:MAG: hypothetical protein GOVbin1578_16 [Prokaryotic dsDNA virus sp.]|tara:strand:- start:2835 stop:3803 length:969 start_codon:yes stop_codon:yes gene_type:complete